MWLFWFACNGNVDPTETGTEKSTSTTETATTETGTQTSDTATASICPASRERKNAVTFSKPPKNLLVVSIDTLRRDFVDFYSMCDGGDPIERMPFFSSLLAQSVSMQDHQQCSNWTFPSTNCTLSGTLLEDMEHVPRGGLDGRPIPDGQRTLASLLSQQGFHTSLIYTNSWFYRIPSATVPLANQFTGNSQGYQVRETGGAGAHVVVPKGIEVVNDALSGKNPPDRWFLHLHFMEPHDLYVAPDTYVPEVQDLSPIGVNFRFSPSFKQAQTEYWGLSDEEKALYREHFKWRYTGDLRELDDRMQAEWKRLQASGLLDDTLVVFWTDHGEAFWERGPQAHGFRLGAEENDAILAYWHPELKPGRIAGPSHSIDFLPTTLNALGLEVPADLKGQLSGTSPFDRVRYIVSPNIRAKRYQAVTHEGFKLVVGWDGTKALYDRNTDPKELVDLYSPKHPKVGPLWTLLRPRIELLDPKIPEGQQPDYDAYAELDAQL